MTDDHADHEMWQRDPADLPIEEPVPVRRGPARPPRRGEGRPSAARSGAGRPGAPGSVPAAPLGGEQLPPSAIAGGYVDDDYYDDDPGDAKLPRWVFVLAGIAVVLGLLAGSVVWWYNRQLDPPGSPGEEVTVQIPRGASTSGIGSILERNDVIPNSMVFNFYASRKDAGPFEAGAYVFQKNSSVDLALEVLAAGPTGELPETEIVKLTIPEGYTVAEIVARTNKVVPRLEIDDLDAALDGEVTTSLRPSGVTSLEGLLFPATYDIGPDRTAAEVLGLLAQEMETRVSRLDAERAVGAINDRYGLELTTYDVLKVASMVQAEAAGEAEAALVASVIYNRLADTNGQFPFLGVDAVDEYGADLAGMTPKEYRATDGEFNTRSARRGLPPTPIGAPGDYALEAAFSPAETDYLWYALTEPGQHSFATNSADHARNVAICTQKGLGCG